jgi:hypothetical protein
VYHPAVSVLDSKVPSSAPGGASNSVAPSGLHSSSAPASAPRWLEHLPLLWIGLALLAFALTAPIRRLGDAADYVMATESLLYDHDLRYTTEDLARHLRLKPIDFDSPAGLHTRPGPGGEQYLGAHHSFYYSIAALPFYAAFGYRGFFLFNALAFWIFTFCLYRHLRTWNGMGVSWAWLLMALVFSASWTYVAWIHTEVFYMSLVGLFLFAWRRGRILWAAAALGVVAAAQPTLSLLGIPFLLLVWLERRRIGLLVGMGGVILLAAAPQVLYNLYAFGVVHPMLLDSSLLSTSYISFGRFIRSWLDPAAGILWFYPAVLVALVEAPRNRRTVVLWIASLAVILACGASVAWYSHQVGLRYGAYVFGVVLFLVEKVRFDRVATAALWSFVVLVGTGLAADPLGNSAGLGIEGKLFLPYRLAASLPRYPEDSSVLWQRLAHLSPSVGISAIWQEGWIPGDTDAMVVAAMPEVGHLRLVVTPWFRPGHWQRLEVSTATGRYAFALAPGAARTIEVPIATDDLLTHTLSGGGWVRIKLRAQGWTPRLAIPAAQDVRRLGVVLEEVATERGSLYRRSGDTPVPGRLLPR